MIKLVTSFNKTRLHYLKLSVYIYDNCWFAYANIYIISYVSSRLQQKESLNFWYSRDEMYPLFKDIWDGI